MKNSDMDMEIFEALEKNNSTAGKLSAVLGVADNRRATIARLSANNKRLVEKLKEVIENPIIADFDSARTLIAEMESK